MAENKEIMSLEIELLKMMLKPGYLYGVGEDGDIYCVKIAKLPQEGDYIHMTWSVKNE